MSKQTLATQGARLKKTIEDKIVLLTAINEKLVAFAGQTFTTTLGTVQVTQQTEDRVTDDYVLVFDKDRYDGLDKASKDRILASGVVRLERKSIKGTAPKVVYRLRK